MRRKLKFCGDPVAIATNISAVPTAPYDDGDLKTIGGGGAGAACPFGQVRIGRAALAGAGTTTLSAGTQLIGKLAGKVRSLGLLNGGAQIVMTENLGFVELVQGASLCTDLAILPPSGGVSGAYDAEYQHVEEVD